MLGKLGACQVLRWCEDIYQIGGCCHLVLPLADESIQQVRILWVCAWCVMYCLAWLYQHLPHGIRMVVDELLYQLLHCCLTPL